MKNITFTEAKAGLVKANVIDDFALQVFHPTNPSDSLNNSSVVVKAVYGDISFIFTGDAEEESEEELLNSGFNLNSTILKVGHHGSSTSTSVSF